MDSSKAKNQQKPNCEHLGLKRATEIFLIVNGQEKKAATISMEGNCIVVTELQELETIYKGLCKVSYGGMKPIKKHIFVKWGTSPSSWNLGIEDYKTVNIPRMYTFWD